MTTPISMTSTSVTSIRKPMTISHSERLKYVQTNVSGDDSPLSGDIFPICPLPVNVLARESNGIAPATPSRKLLSNYYRPGDWLAGLMALFNICLIKRCMLEWVPRCGSADRGNIVVSHLRDVTDVHRSGQANSHPSWATSEWNISDLEATGRQSVSFPVWMNKRIELPLSRCQSFFNPDLYVGSVTDDDEFTLGFTPDQGARSALPDGLWMVGVEGLSRVTGTSSNLLSDYGHFKLTYVYDVSEPVVGKNFGADPATVATVSAVTRDVLSIRHTLVLSQDHECEEIKVDRSGVDPLYSPFKRGVFVGDTLRIGLDIPRAGSAQGVLLFQGCDSISFKGICRRPFSNEDAWEVSESPGEASAFFVRLAEGNTFGSVTYYPID